MNVSVCVYVMMQIMLPYGLIVACKGQKLMTHNPKLAGFWFVLRGLDLALSALGIVVWNTARDMFGGVILGSGGDFPPEYKFIWNASIAAYIVRVLRRCRRGSRWHPIENSLKYAVLARRLTSCCQC